jgi:hypothetical protein
LTIKNGDLSGLSSFNQNVSMETIDKIQEFYRKSISIGYFDGKEVRIEPYNGQRMNDSLCYTEDDYMHQMMSIYDLLEPIWNAINDFIGSIGHFFQNLF